MAFFGARGDYLSCRLDGDFSRFENTHEFLALPIDRIDVIVQVEIVARHIGAKMDKDAFGFAH